MMQNIEFETDQSSLASIKKYGVTPKQSKMVQLLEKLGVTNPVTANYILLGIAVILFGITIFMYRGIFGEQKAPTMSPAEQQTILKMTNQPAN